MARMTREAVAKREQFVREFFQKNPDAATLAVNDEFKKNKEPQMSAKRLYALRKEVRGEVAASPNGKPKIPAKEFAAARRPQRVQKTPEAFAAITAEGKKLWTKMQALGVAALSIENGRISFAGQYQVNESL